MNDRDLGSMDRESLYEECRSLRDALRLTEELESGRGGLTGRQIQQLYVLHARVVRWYRKLVQDSGHVVGGLSLSGDGETVDGTRIVDVECEESWTEYV